MDPTGLDSSVTTTHTLTIVAAGSYSVSVMAVNEYGMSQEMTAPFVVEGTHVLRQTCSAVYTSVGITVCVCVCVCVYFELGSIQVCGLHVAYVVSSFWTVMCVFIVLCFLVYKWYVYARSSIP